MKSVDDSIDYVNSQIKFYKSRLDDPKTIKKHFFKHHLEQNEQIHKHLTALASQNERSDSPSAQTDYLTIRPEDIQGLPTDILEELSLSESDHADFEIVNLVKDHGGIMSLDHMIITLYKETGTKLKRKNLTAKLYRMANKGLIISVPNKRGIYKVPDLNSDDKPAQEALNME